MASLNHEMIYDENARPKCMSPFKIEAHDYLSQCSNTINSAEEFRSRDILCLNRSTREKTDRTDVISLHIANSVSPIQPSVNDKVPTAAIPSGKRDRLWVIARIEDIFEQQLAAIVANKNHLEIDVSMRPRSESDNAPASRRFRFPGRSEKDAWRYTVIIRILELLHDALVTDTIITKRDIYYRDPTLFSKQAVVDRFIDDLAYTFGVSRLLLNVTATAKGLVAGNFSIHRSNRAVANGKFEREGMLISTLKEDDLIVVDFARWVLVVEKEATFRSLVSSPFWARLSSHGLLVTGKGYPDLATRLLLRSIWCGSRRNHCTELSIYGLMDYDPDGMEIISTYKHGSIALSHEKSGLELPSIQWLGLNSRQIGLLRNVHESRGLLRLTERDRRKATQMLHRKVFTDIETEWRRELQVMLFLNMKAEIQLLESLPGGLAEWLSAHEIC
ncbi:uncharacterized protein PV09_02175 [Verruconis gallopava]|uniref:DNA topoisomerase (ATP-hydrolyzing) n=1 Tax=Verruconis gallopava TaxID=253628 RepID=A0A0D2ALC7_9PEZI|nr:uncharacterized protein PV09_02175 [Verruconis gallopava]KIW07325.1 hypothetical protein PV09_02175 [Verruconis gallopava]